MRAFRLPRGRGVASVQVLLGFLFLSRMQTSAQTITVFQVPTSNSDPSGISAGPDGNLWFTENNVGKIGRLLRANGQISEFSIPMGGSPLGIVNGPAGALWYADEANKIGRVQTDGSITEFTLPTPSGFRGPNHICVGPDGNLWFTENLKGAIGRATPAGLITEFGLPNSQTTGITSAPDGRLWFTESSGGIGQITTSGVISSFALPTVGAFPSGITVGPDGALWVAESGVDKIARITLAGSVTEFPVGPPPGASLSVPTDIVTGTDGNLWFTEFFGSSVGRITPGGAVSHFSLPSIYSTSMPFGIVATQDGNIWFTEWRYSLIGRIQIPILPTPTPTSTPTPTPVPTPGTSIPVMGATGKLVLLFLVSTIGTLIALREKR